MEEKEKIKRKRARVLQIKKPLRPRKVAVRLSEEEYAKIFEIAKDTGFTVSDIIRNSATQTRVWTAQTKDVFRKLTVSIDRAGSSLNQIAKHCNTFKSDSSGGKILTQLFVVQDQLDAIRETQNVDRA